MADYYPVLAKAVAGLPDSTAESRHAIYERARGALFGQLRSLDPPVPEETIEREAQALEVAVAQLETEIASRPGPGSGEPVAEPDLAGLGPTAGSPAGASPVTEPSAAPPLPEPNPPNPDPPGPAPSAPVPLPAAQPPPPSRPLKV
ncbi:MAG: histidine kinase, partial [Methylocella sp.]